VTRSLLQKGVCDWIWCNVLRGADNLDPRHADARTLRVRTLGSRCARADLASGLGLLP
jgi:hypothetical protein